MSKIYATVTSERASKGQGGNNFLAVSLTVGSRDNQISAGVVRIETQADRFVGYYISNACREGKNLFIIPREVKGQAEAGPTKGKRQKGEKCKWCNAGSLDKTRANNPFCHNCKQTQSSTA